MDTRLCKITQAMRPSAAALHIASICLALIAILMLAGALVTPFVMSREYVREEERGTLGIGLFVNCFNSSNFRFNKCEFGWNASLQSLSKTQSILTSTFALEI